MSQDFNFVERLKGDSSGNFAAVSTMQLRHNFPDVKNIDSKFAEEGYGPKLHRALVRL